jgi:hypothetical protein
VVSQSNSHASWGLCSCFQPLCAVRGARAAVIQPPSCFITYFKSFISLFSGSANLDAFWYLIQEECDSDPVSACLLDMDMDMVIDLCCFASCDDTSICNIFSHDLISVSHVPYGLVCCCSSFFLSVLCFSVHWRSCVLWWLDALKVLCADCICSFQHHVFCKLRCRFADDSCSSCF